MTLLAFIAVVIPGYGALVHVIARLLAENRRLTAAALSPRADLAVRALSMPDRPSNGKPDEPRLRPVGS